MYIYISRYRRRYVGIQVYLFNFRASSLRSFEFSLELRDSCRGLFQFGPQDVIPPARAVLAKGLGIRRLRLAIRRQQVFHVEVAVELRHRGHPEQEPLRVIRLHRRRRSEGHEDGVFAAAIEVSGRHVVLSVRLAMRLQKHVPDAFVFIESGHEPSSLPTRPRAMYLWDSCTAATETDGFLALGCNGPPRWAGFSTSRSGGLSGTSSFGFWSSYSSESSTRGTRRPRWVVCSSWDWPSAAPSSTRGG